MAFERHVAGSGVVVFNPGEQEGQALVLLIFGWILVRLPGTGTAVGEATLFARIEEDQSGLKFKRDTGEAGIASFDDPVCVGAAEGTNQLLGFEGITRDGDLVGKPGDGIEVETGEDGLRR